MVACSYGGCWTKLCRFACFFFIDPSTTEIYTLSLHDALPICPIRRWSGGRSRGRAARSRAAFGSDRKSTRLNSSHEWISYAVFCLKKKKTRKRPSTRRPPTQQPRSTSNLRNASDESNRTNIYQ